MDRDSTDVRSDLPTRTITYRRLVDLSQPVHPGIPLWPGDPPVQFRQVADLRQEGYFLREFSMGEHSATHINAPASFHTDGVSIDAYPTEGMVAPAVVMDIRGQSAANADYALSWADVEFWEEEHGPVPQGTVVLLYTGWQEKWGDPGLYFGADASGSPHFPGFGNDAARYLLAHRGAAGLGIDTHGLEPGAAAGYPVNKLLLERPRLALENLTNLDQLPPTGATIVVGLVRLTGGSGSPVSVLAFVP